MLPYYPQPALTVGRWHITSFAVCAVCALIAARWIILRRAREFGIGYDEIAPVYVTVVIAGLAGAAFLGLLTASGLTSLGAIAGGVLGGVAYCSVHRSSWVQALTLLDVTAFAAPFAGAIGRLGCTLAHDHRGLPSQAWLAFQFSEGSRWDLGFLDFLFLAGLSGAFVLLDRKPRPPLFFSGVAACAYGGFRLWRETLGVTPEFLPCAALFAIGAAVLAVVLGFRQRVPAVVRERKLTGEW